MMSRSLLEHEARRRRCPPRVAVQHRDDDGHVRAADRHHQVDAEHARDAGHDEERNEPRLDAGSEELGAQHHARRDHAEVHQVAPRQEERLAPITPCSLPERDDGTGEGDGADEDTEEHLDLVDRGVDRARVLVGAEVAAARRPARRRARRSCARSRRARASRSSARAAASTAPMSAPTATATARTPKLVTCPAAVTATAISIPAMPKALPRRAVVCAESPPRLRMKRTPATR